MKNKRTKRPEYTRSTLPRKPRLFKILQLGNSRLAEPAMRVGPTLTMVDLRDARDLLHTCLKNKGAGIAATQVGIMKRIIVVASWPNKRYPNAPKMKPTIMFDPEIITRSERVESAYEGCLSIPGIRGLVPRHAWIKIKYIGMDGKSHPLHAKGFIARIIQHEVDHLNGTVFLGRVMRLEDLISDAVYLEMMKPKPKSKPRKR